MRILAAALVLLVVSQDPPKPVKDEGLRQELFDRVEKDQAARKAFMELMRKRKNAGLDEPANRCRETEN
jgi:hypothetical protein